MALSMAININPQGTAAVVGRARPNVGGWLNAGTYLFLRVVTSIAAGIFIDDPSRKVSLWPASPDRLGIVFAWVVLVVVWFMASREVKGGLGCSW